MKLTLNQLKDVMLFAELEEADQIEFDFISKNEWWLNLKIEGRLVENDLVWRKMLRKTDGELFIIGKDFITATPLQDVLQMATIR